MRGHAAGTERPRAERRVMEPERGAERARSAPGRAAEERRHIEERQRSSEHGNTEPTRAERGNARYDELREARRRLNGEQVRLHEFPAIVVDRAPQLQDYRFLLTADQIVIVDPSDRSIALVLDRT